MIGLYSALAFMGKKVSMVLQDKVPSIYHYLRFSNKIKEPEQPVQGEITIFLDCSDAQRVGSTALTLLPVHNCTINIDHHETNEFFGTYNFVNSRASATAEIIYDLLKVMNVKITPEIANPLYAGIVMDTGSFKYSNTTSNTFKIAGELLDNGVNQSSARINLFESKSRQEILLLRLALQSIDFSDDGKIAWMTLPFQETYDLKALDLHPEGIINYTRMIEGVEVGLLFRETSPGTVKIGFRSKNDVDVAALATEFDGGGHKQAAGARMEGTIEQVKNTIIARIRDVLR
jgi:phosphoesterase RecJ-like protein